MVNRRASEAAPPQTPVAPVVKRKRRASCLGEQERRERKRAIDREAQRSLREKTKTHIAELERTIQILRDQDRNGATSNLLSEINDLRAENERLREVIDSVKSVVGCDLFPRNAVPTNVVATPQGGQEHSPAASSVGQHTPKAQTSLGYTDVKPDLPTPFDLPNPFEYQARIPNTSRSVDLDGMNLMSDMDTGIPAVPDPNVAVDLDLEPIFFGPNWRSPSPVVLHIGNPELSMTFTSNALCPVWKKSNEIFGEVFSYRPSAKTRSLQLAKSQNAEAGLLYLGIKKGWDKTSSGWMQSPALKILKQVDDLLFCHLPNMERLAVAYKSFKLLKYYLNATKEELDKVPEWLRPSPSQSSTKHPVAVDFFAWPTFRDRLVQNHAEIFQNGDLSNCYSQYLRFDWPFAFEDAFFFDEDAGMHYPSPLFERYHCDMKYWTVDERFYGRFPEMKGDIEGDRRRFCEVDE
ncbi:hypothetical protein CC86DRAFT_305466 [Ophiobolus disseminans]|uniref:BZIP domain-containing protein n=1 Tax=Ophiobolus disseminans TaxID=1469910 RepID=A0A6A6ZIR8_9PLEO|nr:hypothetical protein CC86DRAFT_305466 [Ophiobolus disseminans]